MSRIGNKPITVPEKVKIDFDGSTIKAKGPLGELSLNLPKEIQYKYENNTITFSRPNDLKHIRALHGLARALTANIIEGVSNGFSKTLKIEGVGYKVELRGKKLLFSLGYSHPILFIVPDEIDVSIPSVNTINLKSIDKQLLGEVASRIRKLRKPEPYKGKGVRYEGEYIRRKEGKKTTK